MKKIQALLLSVCVSTFVYAQDPSSNDTGVAPERPFTFELPKKKEPLYVVNDSVVITAEQFKAIDPMEIRSIEIRRYANDIVEVHPQAEQQGVMLIYLKGLRSFPPDHSSMASEKSDVVEPIKKMDPIYIVNDERIITADQFKGLNPMHIQSVEVRNFDNHIVAAQNGVAHRGVVLIYLKPRMSFSEEFSRPKKN